MILITSRISVLVNGSPMKEFIPERGLRQGDPLSPLLFNLVGEVLHCMLCKAEEAGIFQGIMLGDQGGTVSHLQYADDTVIFVKNNSEPVSGVKRVLLGFEMLTGLRINFAKSTLYGFNSTVEELMEWSGIIGCKVGADSFNYLGPELAKSPYRVQFWDPLVSKVRRKLADWKGRTMSTAGRIVLLQAALDSLPVYWFNMFLMPRAVEMQLEKMRRFFWGNKVVNGQDRDNMHLIAWDKICQPRCTGGLGLMKVRERNIAMLGKWWWRCINERNRFWNVTLQSKYGRVLGIDPSSITIDGSSSYTLTSLLKIVRMGWDGDKLKNGFIWKFGDGRSVRFWEDIWYGQKALQHEYPRLFHLSMMKTTSLRLIWEIWQNCEGLPSTIWSRNLRGWEEENVEVLNQMLSSMVFSEGKDILYWSWSGKSFSIKDCYVALSNVELMSPICLSFWKLKFPPKVQFFLWKLVHSVLPTKAFLAGRLHSLNLSPFVRSNQT